MRNAADDGLGSLLRFFWRPAPPNPEAQIGDGLRAVRELRAAAEGCREHFVAALLIGEHVDALDRLCDDLDALERGEV